MKKLNPSRDKLAIMFALVFPSALTWLYFVALADQTEVVQQITYGLGKAIQFGFPIVWFMVFQRRSVKLRAPTGNGLTLGLVFGLLVVAAMFLLYFLAFKPLGLFDAASAQMQEKVAAFGVDSVWKFVGLALFYSLFHSLLEEYYWRWFVYGQMRQWTSVNVALLVSSIGFMAHHVIVLAVYFGWSSLLTYLLSASVAVGGLVWAWLYERTQNIYAPWISHLIVDAGIFLLGYDVIRASIQ